MKLAKSGDAYFSLEKMPSTESIYFQHHVNLTESIGVMILKG